MKILWSSEVAYCVGILVTDGTLSADGSHIELIHKDRAQIQYVKEFFDIGAQITAGDAGKLGKGKPKYRMRWQDASLYEFLTSIGFRPYKSLTLGSLKIPDRYFFDFLRGYLEGDSCFSSYFDPFWKENNLFYLLFSSASLEHITWLQEIIERLSGAKGNIARTGNAVRMSNVKYAKQEAIVLLSHMYFSPACVPQSRKRLKLTRALAIVGVVSELT